MKKLALLVAFLGVAGCKDKAEPYYSECVADEAKGDVLEAETACMRAIAFDATSKSGNAAAEKLKAMRPAIDTAKKVKADADAAAAKAADAARVQHVAALKTKVQKRYWDEDTDGECTGKGLPPYRWSYEGGTYAEDREVAEADSCVKLHQSVELRVYCCPEKPRVGLF